MSATAAMAWTEPVRVVLDRLGDGFDALWAVVYTGQLAALQLAMHAPPGEAMPLSGAAWDLGDALGEIEWVRPELAAHGVAVDLGPAPLDDAESCRQALAGVLRLGVDVIDRMLHEHISTDSTGDPDELDVVDELEDLAPAELHRPGCFDPLDTSELCALARVVTLLGRAHVAVAGEPM